MRGKQFVGHGLVSDGRITPAHAGKTGLGFTIFTIFNGSPPLMRGKRFELEEAEKKARITPAHAGKTGQYSFRRKRFQDHPRSCGENRVLIS